MENRILLFKSIIWFTKSLVKSRIPILSFWAMSSVWHVTHSYSTSFPCKDNIQSNYTRFQIPSSFALKTKSFSFWSVSFVIFQLSVSLFLSHCTCSAMESKLFKAAIQGNPAHITFKSSRPTFYFACKNSLKSIESNFGGNGFRPIRLSLSSTTSPSPSPSIR